jgi:hypothetical protein
LRLYHLLLPIWGTLEITGQASKFFSYSTGVANEHQIGCYANGQPQPASMALAVFCMPTTCLYAASHPMLIIALISAFVIIIVHPLLLRSSMYISLYI